MERSLTSLRIPSLDPEKDDNRNHLEKKEEENEQACGAEKSKEEEMEGKLAKTFKPIILILLFLIMLLLLAAGLVILLRKETSSTSSQLTVSLIPESSLNPKEENSTEAPSSSQSSITSALTDMDSSTLRMPVAHGTTYFPDPPPRAGSRLIL